MFRAALRPYFAVLLLLCLGRTLLPEAWLIAGQPHAHTTHEVAYRRLGAVGKARLLLTPRHQHCHVEQFYGAAFVPAASMVRVPQPRRRPRYPAFAGAQPGGCPRQPTSRASLRGPPALG